MIQGSLFNSAPIANAAPPVDVIPSRPSIAPVKRLVAQKAGAFLYLRDGQPTGREFYLAELEDGRVVWQFTDNGEQYKAPVACTRILIDDAIRDGRFVVEVQR